MSPFDESDLFPAPTEKTILNRIVHELESSLEESAPPTEEAERIRLYLADLLVGRNSSADYLRAMELYNEILTGATSGELSAKAKVGKAELLITSIDPRDWSKAIHFCEEAYRHLKVTPTDFFANKSLVVESELRAKRGEPGDYEAAFQLLNRVIESPYSSRYFKIRAIAGKSEVVLYFYPTDKAPRAREIEKCIKLCNEALRFAIARPTDYFTLKLKLILAELLNAAPKLDGEERIKALLYSIIETQEANFQLRARAMLNLAEIVNPVTAQRFVEEVKQIEDLDFYLLKKAERVEAEIKSKNPPTSD